MAVRKMPIRGENTIRGRAPAGKIYYQKPIIKPRAALCSLSSNLVERERVEKDPKNETTRPTVQVPKQVDCFPDVEEMDVVEMTAQLSQQLCIDDIDVIDSDNPQLCAEYAKQIYAYMMKLEVKYHVLPTYFASQPTINSRMRAILVDWLIQVHQRFNLLQETLYLTVSIIDRYLTVVKVCRNNLQLIGVTAMLLASKYEEMYAPEVHDFVFITDDSFTADQIRSMERDMLKSLDYSLGTPLSLHFLRRYSRAGEVTPQIHTMAKFLLELSLPEYTMLEYTPSRQAAAALYIAKMVCGSVGWTPTLEHYSTYSEKDILPCIYKMAELVHNMARAKQQAVKNKYSSSKLMRSSKFDGLFSESMKKLASKAT